MKFFLLFLLSFLAVGFACNTCEEGKKLFDATCSGFKIRNADFWEDYQILENGNCKNAEDTADFNNNYLCCAESEEDCCEDYPTGFYVGFAIGIGGIAFMILFAIYLCVGSGGKSPKVEE